ncbi:hypothetical protein [Saccharospirillum mangrovi]|uniref:hypothetical protein n=1 Tax=Saccharospirillum mangrovi TaxID=2161747 RepID=UPI000D3AD757|nr:hypothetical protein [Saccharospirillum mangrovi]
MNFFLKAKSWQIFMVGIALPIVAPYLAIYFNFKIIAVSSGYELLLIPLCLLIGFVIYFLWFWSLGVGINRRIPAEIRPGNNFFKFSIIFSTFYTPFFLASFLFFSSKLPSWLAPILGLLYFFSIYCALYVPFYIAKNIRTFETNAPATFSSTLGTYFPFLFLPVGIWFIQPRINTIYSSADKA